MLPFRAGKFFRDFPDFLHRPNGVRELRERVRPDGAAPFLHRKAGVRELPQAGSPLTGGVFFAEIQRWGFAVCGRRERRGARRGGAVPTARGKRVDTYGFYPLNSRFPLFPSLAQITDM